jgi:hypothetical protein
MRAHDRQTVITLRHQLQTCQSIQRQALRMLDTFRNNLMVLGEEVNVESMAELMGELATIRAQLAGTGEGDAA